MWHAHSLGDRSLANPAGGVKRPDACKTVGGPEEAAKRGEQPKPGREPLDQALNRSRRRVDDFRLR
jgi:hypothetical protein